MFTLHEVHYQALLAHVRQLAPLEACGLIATANQASIQIFPIENLLASPTRFLMQPAEQITALQIIETNGWELAAIYHSHPAGPPIPSGEDIQQATYPETLHLIFSPTPVGWTARLFRLLPDTFEELPLEISPAGETLPHNRG